MKHSKLIVANWKSNKTVGEAMAWLEHFSKLLANDSDVAKLCSSGGHEIVLAVSNPYLLLVSQLSKDYSFVKVAAQNSSMYAMGSYTGEVSAHALAGMVSYCLVGHSERRHWFGEEGAQIQAKIDLLLHEGVTPIVCVRSSEDVRSLSLTADVVVAYEPDESIGSGLNAPVSQVASIAHQLPPIKRYLYGGSIIRENVAEYMREPAIGGILVGRASLDPLEFYQLIESALTI